jgi:hypothetical protein
MKETSEEGEGRAERKKDLKQEGDSVLQCRSRFSLGQRHT